MKLRHTLGFRVLRSTDDLTWLKYNDNITRRESNWSHLFGAHVRLYAQRSDNSFDLSANSLCMRLSLLYVQTVVITIDETLC